MIINEDIVGQGFAFPPRLDQTGNVALVSGDQEIVQAIQIILLTAIGERVMRPKFGCRIHELVFHPNNGETSALARRYVTEALNMWEPRITVKQVIAKPDPDAPERLIIQIDYIIKIVNDERSLVYPFYLIPEE